MCFGCSLCTLVLESGVLWVQFIYLSVGKWCALGAVYVP